MKLLLQIVLGVFLGSLASQFTFDAWQTHQENFAKQAEDKIRAEEEKTREEQAQKIHDLIMKSRVGNKTMPVVVPPGFTPDDAQEQSLQDQRIQ